MSRLLVIGFECSCASRNLPGVTNQRDKMSAPDLLSLVRPPGLKNLPCSRLIHKRNRTNDGDIGYNSRRSPSDNLTTGSGFGQPRQRKLVRPADDKTLLGG